MGEEKREKLEKFKNEQLRREVNSLDQTALDSPKKEKKEKGKEKKEKKEKDKEKKEKKENGKEKKEKGGSKEETVEDLKQGGYPQPSPETLELHVTHALTGTSLGHFRPSASDSVQELKLEIGRKINAQRPWSASGKLLYQNQVLQETTRLKDIRFEDPIELQYILEAAGEALARTDLVLLPEVVQNLLNPCTLKQYQPNIRWVLKDFAIRGTQDELVEDWRRESERDGAVLDDLTDDTSHRQPWMQLSEGCLGVRRDRFHVFSCSCLQGCLTFSYYAYTGTFQAEPGDHGWHERDSQIDKAKQEVLLSPEGGCHHPYVRSRSVVARQLALPCAMTVLQRQGLELLEVLAADSLHGFGLRLGCDLVLATRSKESTSLVAVYFHLFQLPYAAKLDMFDKDFSNRYFGRGVFMSNLDAAVADKISQVLVLWYSDQAMALRWYLGSIPSTFRDFRRHLAKAWMPDSQFHSFNDLFNSQMCVEPLEPLLVELPKNTCANALCKAGTDCRKHFHLSQVPFVPRCRRENCTGTVKVGRRSVLCDRHHCVGGARLGPPACCLQLWQAVSTSDPWKPKAKAKAKGHRGLQALGAMLEAVRFSEG